MSPTACCPYLVHDVQLTAEPLDGTADFKELDSQHIVDRKTSSHSVRKVLDTAGFSGVKTKERVSVKRSLPIIATESAHP